MTPVKEKNEGGGFGCGEAAGAGRREEAAQSRGWSAETTVDQALIRGLGTAFRGCVSGLSSVLESGRRAEPGHITSDGGSPSVAPSPALCSEGALGRLAATALGVASSDRSALFEDAVPVQAFSRGSGGPQGRP
jgi:hypothetical protein